MAEQTPVESGNQPLVMDALGQLRAARGSNKPAPLPESTVAETPAVPAAAEPQEPAAPVVTEPPKAEPVPTPAAGESKTEPTEPKPAEAKPVEAPKPEEPKGPTDKRDWRIDEYYKQQKELAELKAKATPVPAPPVAESPKAAESAAPPVNGKPVWDPEKYKERGYDGYVEDLATHAAEVKAAAAFAKAETTRRQQEADRQFQEKSARFKQAVADSGIPDYWDVVAKAPVKFSPRSEDFLEECVQSPVGPKILHYLAQNPDQVIRLEGLSKREQFKEFEALETRFKTPATPTAVTPSAPIAAVGAPAPNPGVSKAPPPIKTIAAGAAAPPRKSEAELATASAEEYQAAHPEIRVYRGIHGRKGVQ